MLHEVEMKFPLADRTALEEKLKAWGFGVATNRQETDYYYGAPDRSYAKTDESLRLRHIAEANVLTYKGPRQGDGEVKSRLECEVNLVSGAAEVQKMQELLEHLRYKLFATIQKDRTLYHIKQPSLEWTPRHPVEVCVDAVDDLGSFVELEVIIDSAKEAEGHAQLLELAGMLGLKNAEKRTYLEMLLKRGA